MRLKQVLIALDQLGNALAGGYADETISAKSFRMAKRSVKWAAARKAIDAVFFWQISHCAQAYASEFERRHLPPEYRK
jgi:hypothetical protein